MVLQYGVKDLILGAAAQGLKEQTNKKNFSLRCPSPSVVTPGDDFGYFDWMCYVTENTSTTDV